MNREDYVRLAQALDALPNGFPRTSSGIELLILQRTFTSDEALPASYLSASLETADTIAQCTSLPRGP